MSWWCVWVNGVERARVWVCVCVCGVCVCVCVCVCCVCVHVCARVVCVCVRVRLSQRNVWTAEVSCDTLKETHVILHESFPQSI